jgi:hypothetical protein
MYPDRELSALAARKVELQRAIGRQRVACVALASRVAQPLAWLDRALAWWRKTPPLLQSAAMPLALLMARSLCVRRKGLCALVRWSPVVWRVIDVLVARAKDRSRRSSG